MDRLELEKQLWHHTYSLTNTASIRFISVIVRGFLYLFVRNCLNLIRPKALALMKQFFGREWRSRVKVGHSCFDVVLCHLTSHNLSQELNASDERGISAVREKANIREYSHIVAVMHLKLWKDVKSKKTKADAYLFQTKSVNDQSSCWKNAASAARGKDLCAIVYRLGPPRGSPRTSRIELTWSHRVSKLCITKNHEQHVFRFF